MTIRTRIASRFFSAARLAADVGNWLFRASTYAEDRARHLGGQVLGCGCADEESMACAACHALDGAHWKLECGCSCHGAGGSQ